MFEYHVNNPMLVSTQSARPPHRLLRPVSALEILELRMQIYKYIEYNVLKLYNLIHVLLVYNKYAWIKSRSDQVTLWVGSTILSKRQGNFVNSSWTLKMVSSCCSCFALLFRIACYSTLQLGTQFGKTLPDLVQSENKVSPRTQNQTFFLSCLDHISKQYNNKTQCITTLPIFHPTTGHGPN